MASFQLANLAIGAAQSATALTSNLTGLDANKRSVIIQANFAYGAGGTSVDAYVQSSCDGGATWYDVCNFHFTTSAGIRQYNLSMATPVTSIATPTDGSLTANTSVDGLVGDMLRVKYVSVGTYTGASSLLVTAVAR